VTGRAIFLGTISAAMLTACAVAPVFAVDARVSVDLGEHRIGAPPEDFEFAITGHGQPGQWTVVRDTTATDGVAIEQSSKDPTENRYPLAIYAPLSPRDFEVSVRFKIVNGTMQSAGIAARFVNADNYYVVSASALEERVDLFRVVNGKMERIWGTDADVTRYHWHTLSLVAKHDEFTVFLDNTWVFTAQDRTFLADGRIGLWTEEDNVTRFDHLEITPLPWSEAR
jgi:hypothetical protein